jgi:tetratricopeptide (TPR) repeat protein
MTESREPYADELPELFSTAIALDAEARVPFLHGLRGTRPALAARLEELLAADRDAGAFLERPLASPGVSAALTVGDVVEGFRVEANLASGANGSVYRATQDFPRRTVALKVLHFALPSAGAIARFRLEVRTLARLGHPGIVPLFAAGVIDPESRALPWFAMELVDGARDIRSWGREQPIEARVRTVADACDAVHHAHLKGVIHRDLKPGNLLVGTDGRARVIDFGVATSAGSAATLATHIGSLTPEGAVVGTFAYMSPEQLEASRDVDARTDIYALGVLLYELCTGRLPFDFGRTPAQAMRAIAIDAALDPVRAAPHERALRGDLAAIILKAIERDPARRYESAAEFGADLRRWIAREPVIARRPGMLERSWRGARRRPVLSTAIVLATLAAAGITTASVIGGSIAYREATRAQRYISGLIAAIEDPSVSGRGRDARMADAADAIVRGVDSARLPADEEADGRMIAGRIYELLNLFEESLPQYQRAHSLRVEYFGATSAEALETLAALARAVGAQRSLSTASGLFLTDRASAEVVAGAFRATVAALGWHDPRTLDAFSWSTKVLRSDELRTTLGAIRDGDSEESAKVALLSAGLGELAARGELLHDPTDAPQLAFTVELIESTYASGRADYASFPAELAFLLTRPRVTSDMTAHPIADPAARRIVRVLRPVFLTTAVSQIALGQRRMLALACHTLGDREGALALFDVNMRVGNPALGFGQQAICSSAVDAARVLEELDRLDEAIALLARAAAMPVLENEDRFTAGWRASTLAAYARFLRLTGSADAALAYAKLAREAQSRSNLAGLKRMQEFARDLEFAERGAVPGTGGASDAGVDSNATTAPAP